MVLAGRSWLSVGLQTEGADNFVSQFPQKLHLDIPYVLLAPYVPIPTTSWQCVYSFK
jgi:hypothetical protein